MHARVIAIVIALLAASCGGVVGAQPDELVGLARGGVVLDGIGLRFGRVRVGLGRG